MVSILNGNDNQCVALLFEFFCLIHSANTFLEVARKLWVLTPARVVTICVAIFDYLVHFVLARILLQVPTLVSAMSFTISDENHDLFVVCSAGGILISEVCCEVDLWVVGCTKPDIWVVESFNSV